MNCLAERPVTSSNLSSTCAASGEGSPVETGGRAAWSATSLELLLLSVFCVLACVPDERWAGEESSCLLAFGLARASSPGLGCNGTTAIGRGSVPTKLCFTVCVGRDELGATALSIGTLFPSVGAPSSSASKPVSDNPVPDRAAADRVSPSDSGIKSKMGFNSGVPVGALVPGESEGLGVGRAGACTLAGMGSGVLADVAGTGGCDGDAGFCLSTSPSGSRASEVDRLEVSGDEGGTITGIGMDSCSTSMSDGSISRPRLFHSIRSHSPSRLSPSSSSRPASSSPVRPCPPGELPTTPSSSISISSMTGPACSNSTVPSG